jgi:hypothetical protein
VHKFEVICSQVIEQKSYAGLMDRHTDMGKTNGSGIKTFIPTGSHGRMVVGFTTTYAISAYHH